LIYNFALASDVQQVDSGIGIHISILFQILSQVDACRILWLAKGKVGRRDKLGVGD